MEKKLNLGCGKDVLKGWENYDKYPVNEHVKYINLNEFPLPFPDNFADEIKLSHVVEHIVYRKEFMMEISRILKPNGKVFVVLPCFNPSLDHKSILHIRQTWNLFVME